MMYLNPEFTRIVWQEITWPRLLIMPLAIGLVLMVAALLEFPDPELPWTDRDRIDVYAAIMRAAAITFILVTGIWGTRLAADAILEEKRSGTWEQQRMSALSVWQLATGKLFGATVFAWYGGVFCLVALGVSGYIAKDLPAHWRLPDFPVDGSLPGLIVLIGAALFAHAAAMIVSLQTTLFEDGVPKRGGTTLAHVVAVLAALFLASTWEIDRWYGWTGPGEWYLTVKIWFFAAWAVIGVFMMMRRELQLVHGPWVFMLFILSATAFYAGQQSQLLTLPGVVLVLGLVYALALTEETTTPGLKRLTEAVQRGHLLRAMRDVPRSAVAAALLVLLVALLFVEVGMREPEMFEMRSYFGRKMLGALMESDVLWVTLAALLFVLRDWAFILFVRLGKPASGGVAATVFLAIYYLLAVPVANVFPEGPLTPFLFPVPAGAAPSAMTVVAPLFELTAMMVLLVWRFLTLEKRFRAHSGSSGV